MTPAARLQAALEVLDEVIASARNDGPPADAIVTRYFKTRRYAGSKDRRAVRELVFRAIRRSAEMPSSGRAAILGMVEDEPDLLELFGQPRGPEARVEGEAVASAGAVPDWLVPELSPLVGPDEWAALLERAPLDLRVNAARANREEIIGEFPEAMPTPHSPWGVRLPPDSRVDDQPAFLDGRVEIQDEGSQLIALACDAQDGERLLDLCAGAGGKCLALAAARRARRSSRRTATACACRSSSRARSGRRNDRNPVAQPAQRARPAGGLAGAVRSRAGRRPLLGQRNLAAQSGRPLAADAQASRPPRDCSNGLLDIAAELVSPGGRLVYAVCSLLSREGAGQVARLSWPPFIVDYGGNGHSRWAFGWCRPAFDTRPRRHRWLFRRAA